LAGISINGKTRLYGIIGNPVNHSFSPHMHSLAFQEIGFNAVYLPFPTHEERLPRMLDAFGLIGVKGFNVTHPFKEKIIPLLNDLADEAATLQSVNTVKLTAKGWKGYSTDGSGFIRSLAAASVLLRGKKVCIIGAGGAARAVALSLLKEGISELNICNRTRSRAEKLAGLLEPFSADAIVNVVDAVIPCDILINATSVGMETNATPVPKETLPGCGLVIDIIYHPSQTPLLKHAAEQAIPFMNGLDMLLYQGVEAFEIWTGRPAPVVTMRQSLVSSICAEHSEGEDPD